MEVLVRVRNALFGRYLWITNTVSSGVLLALGDNIQQRIENFQGTSQDQDWVRNGRMFVVGLLQGPPNHLWYTFLDHFLPGRSLSIVIRKILADQIIASPAFSSSFFLSIGVLEGRSVNDSWEEYKNKFILVYGTDWAVWPPTQLVNFLFVPAAYRVMYINVATIGWNVFMSYAKFFDKKGELLDSADLPAEDLL